MQCTNIVLLFANSRCTIVVRENRRLTLIRRSAATTSLVSPNCSLLYTYETLLPTPYCVTYVMCQQANACQHRTGVDYVSGAFVFHAHPFIAYITLNGDKKCKFNNLYSVHGSHQPVHCRQNYRRNKGC